MSHYNPLSQLKSLLLPLIVFSFVTNLAVLVSPIFMMQVLDRVVPSGNLATLWLLLSAAMGALAVHAVVEYCRDISFQRVARWVEAVSSRSAVAGKGENGANTIAHLKDLRGFFQSQAAHALNLPWIPLFMIALFAIHPLFVVLVIAIAALQYVVKTAAGFLSRDALQTAQTLSERESDTLSDATDPQVAAGMRATYTNLADRFLTLQAQRHIAENAATSASVTGSSVQNALRMAAQISALALGAALVVQGDLSSGGMIGASIICSKTIGILEASFNSVPHCRRFLEAYKALGAILAQETVAATELDILSGELNVQGLISPRGGGAPARLERVSFSLGAGECLAIVGGSGSGKSTLLDAISGVAPCPIGSVFFDETELRTLGPATASRFIGILPQQARLTKGRLADNISCFAPNPDDDAVVSAAKTAGVHGLISSLPDAYATDIGANPHLLSAGQKQRVALARAIYHQPKYLFLDEPNALLDAEGERQLCETLAQVKQSGTTIVMVLHRSGIMGLADKILMLDQGRMTDFGPRAEVLARMNDGKQRLRIPLNAQSLQDLNDWIWAQFQRSDDDSLRQKAMLTTTELFNAACQFGAAEGPRFAMVNFRFVEATKCEIILSEDAATNAAKIMPKIRSLVAHPEVNMFDLPPEEIALAVVAQVAESFEVKNIDEASHFMAILCSDRNEQAAQVAH